MLSQPILLTQSPQHCLDMPASLYIGQGWIKTSSEGCLSTWKVLRAFLTQPSLFIEVNSCIGEQIDGFLHNKGIHKASIIAHGTLFLILKTLYTQFKNTSVKNI